MYILLSSVVIDILLTLTGQCSHTMLIIGTSPLYYITLSQSTWNEQVDFYVWAHFPVWEMWNFGILNLRNNKPSKQWTPISDKWPFGPINLRHNKPFFRNNEPSEQWTFGTMNLRNNEPSEKWTFGKADCYTGTARFSEGPLARFSRGRRPRPCWISVRTIYWSGDFQERFFLFDPSLTSGMSAALMQGHCLRRIKQHMSGHRKYHRQLPPHLTRHETLHAAGLD